jgi:CBS domain-containing protein
MLNAVASLLKQKEKSELVAIGPSASVADAVRAMNDENVGAVVVMDGQNLVGIFTERDVSQLTGAHHNCVGLLV